MTIKEVLELGNEETFTVQGVSFKMILVEGGNFYMGAERGERIIAKGLNWERIRIDSTVQNYDEEAADNESPVHLECLNDYYIGETQVTQELWQAVMGNNPSHFKGADRPVENVSWNECQEFITKLNSFFPDRPFFCLPTETEWEYAARGGVKSQYLKYAGSNNIDEVAWYWRNSGDSYLSGPDMDGNADKNTQDMKRNHCCTHPVKGKLPNELGLYDMCGNVMEWCQSRYSDYGSNPDKNADRVLRGGCCDLYSVYCRITQRNSTFAKYKGPDCGFRLVWHIDTSAFH